MSTFAHAGWIPDTIDVPAAARLVPTPVQMARVRRVLTRSSRFPTGRSLSVWYGKPGMGKSAAAQLLCRHALESPHGQAALITAVSTRVPDVLTALRGVLRAGMGQVPERVLRNRDGVQLADMIMAALFASNVRILVVDEAGYLGSAGLEAIGTLLDRATHQDEKLHVVLVGMQNLRAILRANPRMASRVSTWEAFDAMPLGPFGDVLRSRFPDVLEALEDAGEKEVMELIHKRTEGSLRDALHLLENAAVMFDGRTRPSIARMFSFEDVQDHHAVQVLGPADAEPKKERRRCRSMPRVGK